MKQTTKSQFRKGVEKRMLVNEGDPVSAVTDTILSAISNGYDKIRVNEQLHITVKKHKGGKARDFKTGEIKQARDYYVLNVMITPAMATALHNRDVGQAETTSVAEQPSASIIDINSAKSA